jgi:NosR/NirI family nitrous oxide reductase transcriptional regulator
MGLLGATFYSFDLAIAGTSVEPFKTAITFRFDAPWPAVIYAVALLGAGLFVERFYCRFVCPLGAGLSILGRVRMFDWLKRRPQCGSQCHVCEAVCPVGAIKRSGEIDMNECFYCLDCQVTYYDDHKCPPLIARRKRSEGRAGKRPAAEPAIVDEAMRQSAE